MAAKKPKPKTEWTKDELAKLRLRLADWRMRLVLKADYCVGQLREWKMDVVITEASPVAETMYILKTTAARIVQANTAMRHLDLSEELRAAREEATGTVQPVKFDVFGFYDTGLPVEDSK